MASARARATNDGSPADLPPLSGTLKVHMVRPALGGFPQVPVPAGYRLRPYRTGDADGWTALHRATERFQEIADGLFREQFGADEAELAARMVFLEDDAGALAGTAAAWFHPDWNGTGAWGRVHWVAVAPAHQGRGLAKPLMTAVMDRLAARHSRAFLGTHQARLPAIKLYLDFGFVPAPGDLAADGTHRAWADVARHLAHPALGAALDQPPGGDPVPGR